VIHAGLGHHALDPLGEVDHIAVASGLEAQLPRMDRQRLGPPVNGSPVGSSSIRIRSISSGAMV
jgi:hypothetical protein